MSIIEIKGKDFSFHESDAYIFFEDNQGGDFLDDASRAWNIDLSRIIFPRGHDKPKNKIAEIPILDGETMRYVVCVEWAQDKKDGLEGFRRAVGKGIRTVLKHAVETVTLVLPSLKEGCGYTAQELVYEATLICHMTQYHFADYITDEKRKEKKIVKIFLAGASADVTGAQEAVEKGTIVATAVNKTRQWIDLPPSFLTPPYLADQAVEIVRKHPNLSISVFTEEQVIAMGMGGLAGVSRGSDVECRLVVMEYQCASKDAPTIAFVGKGITFDSGGLSIKPAASMETMKDDMSGAAAVISVMEALAQLKPSVNVIGVTPLSENLPSGKALKPGDIVRFYNGKTAEVKNTDAEGRLVLADALSYAVQKYKLDAIIDIATLTGACAYALGHFYTGLMSQHDDLVAKICSSADRTGDRVWRLPMDNDYKAAITSSLADICNIGSAKYMAGAITASFFLQNFVGTVPWAHLDIAGSSFDVPDIPYFRVGASGAGVRLLIDYALEWQK